jgi:hypothetical protein
LPDDNVAEQIAAGNAGWRRQFRFAVHAGWSRVPELWTLGHERFWILLCWFGWRRFGQFDLDEQDFGSSFEFSSRRFARRASNFRVSGFA